MLYFVFELLDYIFKFIDWVLMNKGNLENIKGMNCNWYEKCNEVIINYFKNVDYLDNVVLINFVDYFCGDKFCFFIID